MLELNSTEFSFVVFSFLNVVHANKEAIKLFRAECFKPSPDAGMISLVRSVQYDMLELY